MWFGFSYQLRLTFDLSAYSNVVLAYIIGVLSDGFYEKLI